MHEHTRQTAMSCIHRDRLNAQRVDVRLLFIRISFIRALRHVSAYIHMCVPTSFLPSQRESREED